MQYVITGGAGHISKPIAEQLLRAGHQVTVVGRSAANLEPLTALGATAAVGSVEDAAFLQAAFAGADAVYAMIPPNFGAANWRAYQNEVAKNYINAINTNGIKKVVMLSSVGAHMGNGAGPVDGLADFEKLLNEQEGLDVKILRPSFFMYNLFSMIPMIKHMNIMGGNYGSSDEKLALVHTNDIAAAAAEELLALNFSGKSIRYIAGDERHPKEIAEVLGNAIGRPGIPWIVFPDDQAKAGMLQMGLSETIASGYVALGKALQSGEMQADYWKHRPQQLGNIKLEEFAKAFAAAYNA
jgi:uncharacterized protein YbjT (DUF2867 family)